MRIRLDKLGDFKNGANFSLGAYGTGFPIVNVKQLYSGRYVTTDSLLKVSASAIPNPKSLFLIRGDILFARSSVKASGAGQVAMIDACPADTVFSGFIIRFRISAVDKALPEYLNYVLRSPEYREVLTRMGTGTTITNLSQTVLGGLEVDLPCLSEQRTIAAILGALDDKIELNRQMNETLEAMARALFKSWFVDFDPVRAKAEGRGPGVPKPIADLFPARLVDSELDEIPEGWSEKPLDEMARFVNGLALQKYPPSDGKSLPVIKIAQLRSRNTGDADRASSDLAPDYIVQDGDILFSWSGSLECVLWAGGSGALNQHLFKVIPTGYPRWLCYLGIHLHLEDFRHIAAGKATTMGHIQRHHLSDTRLSVPPRPLIGAADKIMEPIVESLWQREVQSRTLAAIRDALLPKLISGKLRVKEAERVVAEAAA